MDTSFAGQSLANADLRGKDLRGKVFFDADLRGAMLYDAGISLNCATFDGVKLDDQNIAVLLKLISLADMNPRWKDGINRLVADVMTERTARAIDRYLQIHM